MGEGCGYFTSSSTIFQFHCAYSVLLVVETTVHREQAVIELKTLEVLGTD
jgi:hypothetical protein